MKTSWRTTFRRLAAGCAVTGSLAWSSAMCYAVQLAHDTAMTDAYKNNDSNNGNDGNPANNTNGWVEGDNGGTGFGAWNFDLTYNSPVQQRIDDGARTGAVGSSTFNQIGRAWSIFNPVGGAGGDLSQSGRSFSPLQVGQTLSIEFDTPTESMFYRGFTVKLNHGGANGCYAGDNCTTPAYDPGAITTRASAGIFGYGHSSVYGRWLNFPPFNPNADGWPPVPSTPQNPGHYTHETDEGARLDFTLTGPETFTWTMDPFQAGLPSFSHSGTLPAGNMGQHVGKTIDWVELEFYNTTSDVAYDTDWFIRSMTISSPDPVGAPGDFNNDTKVDAADYVKWRKNTANNALPNDNGLTTQAARFNLWRSNFGNMAGSGSGGVGAVPEPGTFVYLVSAALGSMAAGLRRPR